MQLCNNYAILIQVGMSRNISDFGQNKNTKSV